MKRIALTLALMLAATGAQAGEAVLGPADRAGVWLTLYQDGLGLVRDRRTADLEKGPGTLVMEGIAREARPGSGLLSGEGIRLRGQGFDLAFPSQDALLAASVGREVGVIWHAGAEREERAKVLAAQPAPVFLIGGKVVSGQPARVMFDALPPGLSAQPSYRAEIVAETAGKREVELAYLTGGLSWQADYTAELAPNDDKVTLSAFATLTNESGADFPQARVEVVAGRVNQTPPQPLPRAMMRMEKTVMSAAMVPAEVAAPQPAPGPYHAYALPNAVNLPMGATTQVALMAPTTMAAERSLVLEPLPAHAWRSVQSEMPAQHPQVVLKFKAGDRPLPEGVVRVYRRHKDGGLAFLGEDRVAATPAGTSARIVLGQVFDVTARRVQTDFQRVSSEVSEAAWEVRLANAGTRPAHVTVREAFSGEWLVVDQSQEHAKDGAFVASWTVNVPAKGEAVLKYRVRVK